MINERLPSLDRKVVTIEKEHRKKVWTISSFGLYSGVEAEFIVYDEKKAKEVANKLMTKSLTKEK